jgi:hypothetical protein
MAHANARAKRKDAQDGKAPPSRGYARPLLQRQGWTSLDGEWDFAIDPEGAWRQPGEVAWASSIRVPFSPETPMSGVADAGLYKAVWYRRVLKAPSAPRDHRIILHFGAVDYEATVWIDGRLAMRHEGGYTPFSADITDLLEPGKDATITVRAGDDPADLAKPRGKQDWKPEPHSIWYYRTTGIWQSVWMEAAPPVHIARLRWMPDAVNWEVGLEVHFLGQVPPDAGWTLRVRLSQGDRLIAEDQYGVRSDSISRRIIIPDPGIDDYRNELRWSPESPRLIDAELELRDAQGQVIDHVTSYTALRAINLLGNRFVLNGKPYTLRLVLDQGYWPESGLTAPDDDAFRLDIERVKAMGFNGVRKHQKIEDPRFLYWADRMGLLVWEEMPSCYAFSMQACQRLTSQWTEAIVRDISHPCIIAWVPFNESWGVPDLPDSTAQRHFIQALYHLTKTLDPTRPVIGNDGWEAAATDLVTIHDYDADPRRLATRYGASGPQGVAAMLQEERPGHRILMLQGFAYADQPIMLTEFGGIALSRNGGAAAHSWGYSRANDPHTFTERYFALLETVRSLPLLAGFCYTQFTDTYQEANGLLYMDRTPKVPLEQIAIATRGPQGPHEEQIEAGWRSQVMRSVKRSEASGASAHTVTPAQ